MSVPVLSMHRTSTRASTSTAGSSWTSTRRFASRTTPTANATLVRSTRPSGTIATVPATAPRSASRTLAFERSWLTTSSAAVGISNHVTIRRILSIPLRSSERVRLNRRPCSASCAAYACAPTRVARNRPLPAATNDPDSTSSPGDLITGSASPVSSDSSTSSAAASSTSPSTTI